MPKKTGIKSKTKIKNAARKTAKKKTIKKIVARKSTAPKKMVQQPIIAASKSQPAGLPPSGRSISYEETVGNVTHYYSDLKVATVQLIKGAIRKGCIIHIKGATTDFTQPVESMKLEHQPIDQASACQSVDIKVNDRVEERDTISLVYI